MITFAKARASMRRAANHLPSEHASGEAALATGTYEQVNIFGRPNGIRVEMLAGQPFPSSPIGHLWRAVERDGGER
jgi:hypothetical protein